MSKTIIVAVVNHKGGTGKSTTAWASAAELALRGLKVLVVDLDAQASLSLATGVLHPERTVWTAFETLLKTGGVPQLDDIIVPLTPHGLDLLPANLALSAADLALGDADLDLLEIERRELVLRKLLAPVAASGLYDVILLDCPPALSLLVLNALSAAQEVIIPVQPDYLAVGGLSLFLQTVARVRHPKLNPALRIRGLVLTMTASHTKHDESYIPQLHEVARSQRFPVLAEIPRATSVRDATAAGVPPTLYARRQPAGEAYIALADQLINDWGYRSLVEERAAEKERRQIGEAVSG